MPHLLQTGWQAFQLSLDVESEETQQAHVQTVAMRWRSPEIPRAHSAPDDTPTATDAPIRR